MNAFLSAAVGSQLVVIIGGNEVLVRVVSVTTERATLGAGNGKTYVLHPNAVIVVT